MSRRRLRNWIVRFEFKPTDCWIGVFWRNCSYQCDIWICLLPMVPFHIAWVHGWRLDRGVRKREVQRSVRI